MGFRRNGNKSNDEKVKLVFSRDAFLKSLKVFRFLRPYTGYMVIGFFLLTLSSLVFMIFPISSGTLIDIAQGKSKFGWTLNDVGIGLLVILIIQSIVSYIRVMIFTYVSEKSMADIRKTLFEKIISFPITFFENNRVGDLTSRTTNDVQQLQDALTIHVAEFIRQIIVLIVGIAYLVYNTPRLSLVMFATFPVIVIVAMVFGRFIRRFSNKRQDELAKTNVILDESLQSIAAVKAFTNEWFESRRYNGSIDRVVDISMSYGRWRGAFLAFIIAILFGAIFFVFWQGAAMLQSGIISTGDLVSFIVITGIIGGSIGSLGDLYTQLMRAIGSSERIVEMLDLPQEVDVKQDRSNKLKVVGDIIYKNVGFSYPARPEMMVLEDIDFSIKQGQKVALVGSSGAGKSTIVQLLMRFYPVSIGEIIIDGQNINSFNITSFRENLAIVPQEIMLFGGTIKENIIYGKPDATEEEIKDAARRSYCLEFIDSFPEGFNTIVGERGIKLSGGQRQRIAIARAILKNPSILILDEATSSLDAESEKLVQAALEELMRDRTSIIIAHRLATIRNVDQIYVLEGGRILEKGTHEELFRNVNGLYHNLAKLQFEPEQGVVN